MRLPPLLHRWSLSPRSAIALQRRLAQQVCAEGELRQMTTVAGVDAAFSPDGLRCVAGVVVWDVADRRIVEQHHAWRAVRFPYVPGLLSFREGPAVLAAIRKLCCEPDVFLFDAQGLAHPRRLGLASHVGVLIDRPAVGCAKSLLVGEYIEPGPRAGDRAELRHRGDRIGMVLRTRDRVRCVYVSVGHKLGLEAAVELVRACVTRYRLPEPARQAHLLVTRLRAGKSL